MNRNDAAPTAAPTSVGTIAPSELLARPSAAQAPTTANRPTITRADEQALADGDDAHHERVGREQHADADEQGQLVVGAEQVDRRLLQRRVLGEDVDHPVADVEHRRTPRLAQRRQRFGDAEGDEGDDDPGVPGDGRRPDERGQEATQAVHRSGSSPRRQRIGRISRSPGSSRSSGSASGRAGRGTSIPEHPCRRAARPATSSA